MQDVIGDEMRDETLSVKFSPAALEYGRRKGRALKLHSKKVARCGCILDSHIVEQMTKT